MKNAQQETPWAPDDCPDDVVELIDIDNHLHALGLRGLGSADSKHVRAGFRQLNVLLRENYLCGRRHGVLVGIAVALLAACFAIATVLIWPL